jgi:hypothetical protein
LAYLGIILNGKKSENKFMALDFNGVLGYPFSQST